MSNDPITQVVQSLEVFQEKLTALDEKMAKFEEGIQELKYELEKCRDDLR